MARHATAPLLLMLNNDTVLQDGWLEPMIACLDGDQHAAVVGNQQRYPGTNRLHHAGGCFAPDGLPLHLYDGWPDTTKGIQRIRPVQFVTAACWLTRREHFLKLGGLDEAYVFGFEDIDFCLRTREAGHTVLYCGLSMIEHHGSATPGRYLHDQANWQIFQKRWIQQANQGYQLDAETLAAEDGNRFPDWGFTYRLLRQIKSSQQAPPLLRVLDRLPLYHHARRALRARFNTKPPPKADQTPHA